MQFETRSISKLKAKISKTMIKGISILTHNYMPSIENTMKKLENHILILSGTYQKDNIYR